MSQTTHSIGTPATELITSASWAATKHVDVLDFTIVIKNNMLVR